MRVFIFIILLMYSALASAAIYDIELNNDDRLSGRIDKQTDNFILLDHPLLGLLQISVEDIKQISLVESVAEQEPTSNKPDFIASKQSDNIPAEQPGLFGTRFLQGWTRHIGTGFSGSEGNSQVMNFNIGLDTKFKDEWKRSEFSSAFFFARSNNETSKNKANAQLIRDWLKPESRWFYFGQGRYDYDQFESWDHRISGSGGLGYELIESERAELRGRLGLGLTRTYGDDDDDLTPEAVLGLEGLWNINQNQKLTAKNTLYPDFENEGEFRNISSADWTIKVNEWGNMNLKFGLQNEYISDPQGDAKNNDLDYYGRLGYDF